MAYYNTPPFPTLYTQYDGTFLPVAAAGPPSHGFNSIPPPQAHTQHPEFSAPAAYHSPPTSTMPTITPMGFDALPPQLHRMHHIPIFHPPSYPPPSVSLQSTPRSATKRPRGQHPYLSSKVPSHYRLSPKPDKSTLETKHTNYTSSNQEAFANNDAKQERALETCGPATFQWQVKGYPSKEIGGTLGHSLSGQVRGGYGWFGSVDTKVPKRAGNLTLRKTLVGRPTAEEKQAKKNAKARDARKQKRGTMVKQVEQDQQRHMADALFGTVAADSHAHAPVNPDINSNLGPTPIAFDLAVLNAMFNMYPPEPSSTAYASSSTRHFYTY